MRHIRYWLSKNKLGEYPRVIRGQSKQEVLDVYCELGTQALDYTAPKEFIIEYENDFDLLMKVDAIEDKL